MMYLIYKNKENHVFNMRVGLWLKHNSYDTELIVYLSVDVNREHRYFCDLFVYYLFLLTLYALY